MRVILLFRDRVSVSLRRLSNRNPTAEPIANININFLKEQIQIMQAHREDMRETQEQDRQRDWLLKTWN